MKWFISIVLVCSPLLAAPATQPTTGPALSEGRFSKEISKTVSFRYLVHFPRNYEQVERAPLLVVLHGSGSCGTDLKKVEKLPEMILAGREDFPCVVVAPQLSSAHDWWSPEALDVLLDDLLATYRIDVDRVCLTGVSLGAYGVWDWANHSPQRFAAIVPISGEPNTDWYERLLKVPVWAFHGGQDKEVWPHEDQKMIKLLQQAGAEAKLTMYEDLGHNAWSRAYADPELWKWMLGHRRGQK